VKRTQPYLDEDMARLLCGRHHRGTTVLELVRRRRVDLKTPPEPAQIIDRLAGV
jgi:hypothetical protein